MLLNSFIFQKERRHAEIVCLIYGKKPVQLPLPDRKKDMDRFASIDFFFVFREHIDLRFRPLTDPTDIFAVLEDHE